MRGKAIITVSIFLLLSISLTGCNKTPPFSSSSPIQSPLSSPQSYSDCTAVDDKYGAVTGKLYLISSQPAIGSILYLGEYINAQDSPAVVLDIARHPHTQTNEKGEFCFPAVPPGDYGLIVWDAIESVLLIDINTNQMITVHVSAGVVTNVGTVYSPIP